MILSPHWSKHLLSRAPNRLAGRLVFTQPRTTSFAEYATMWQEFAWIWIMNSTQSLTNTSQLARNFFVRMLLNQPVTKGKKWIPSYELTNFLLCPYPPSQKSTPQCCLAWALFTGLLKNTTTHGLVSHVNYMKSLQGVNCIVLMSPPPVPGLHWIKQYTRREKGHKNPISREIFYLFHWFF